MAHFKFVSIVSLILISLLGPMRRGRNEPQNQLPEDLPLSRRSGGPGFQMHALCIQRFPQLWLSQNDAGFPVTSRWDLFVEAGRGSLSIWTAQTPGTLHARGPLI